MNFGTFIDRSGNWIDTVHFPPVVARYPFRGKGIYQLTGLVVDEFGFLSIEVSEMNRLAYVEDVRFCGIKKPDCECAIGFFCIKEYDLVLLQQELH